MNKLLIVVDMQNDFIEGPLRTDESIRVVPKVVEKIQSWDGDIIATYDTHAEDYLFTNEGKHLPIPHCIEGKVGHDLNPYVQEALYEYKEKNPGNKVWYRHKFSFGDYLLPEMVESLYRDHHGDEVDLESIKPEHIEIIGVCTDICVISNALILKAAFPETRIVVDRACTAGSSLEMRRKAFDVMENCHIDLI